jgi:two-component system sensor kinase FixL
MHDAEATAYLASSQSDGVSHVQGTLTASSDTLIRTMDGQITFWSPDLEERYGFTCSEALGRTSHQLLRTIFPLKLPEIEATLAYQKTWSGMLIHRHAGGRAVMTVNHWHVNQDIGNQPGLVTEVHSDIAQESKEICCQIANLLAVLAHELSEPLTAISNYADGAQRILQKGWPDLENVRNAMAQVSSEVARGAEGVHLLRDLAIAMRARLRR